MAGGQLELQNGCREKESAVDHGRELCGVMNLEICTGIRRGSVGADRGNQRSMRQPVIL